MEIAKDDLENRLWNWVRFFDSLQRPAILLRLMKFGNSDIFFDTGELKHGVLLLQVENCRSTNDIYLGIESIPTKALLVSNPKSGKGLNIITL